MPPVIYILAAAAFSVSTAEFIVSGLLPALAGDLHVTIPAAGLLVTAYAGCVAVASPVIAALTAGLPRRLVLLAVLTIFIAGQVVCALAPNYAVLLVSRLSVASAQGMFFSVALIVVGNSASEATRGRAFSLFFTGLTLATILGVPGGTAIGGLFGWRAAFWFVGGLSALAAIGAFLLVPRDNVAPTSTGISLRMQFRQLARQEIYLSYLAIGFDALGYFCFITYQVPLMTSLAGIAPEQTPLFLLVAGVGTVGGTIASGRLADWKLMPSLIGVTLLQLAVFVAMAWGPHNAIMMGVEMFLGGVGIGAFASPVQARIIAAAHAAPNLASGLISTAFNVGISGGALAGSLILGGGFGYGALPLFGTICMVAAVATVFASWRLDLAAAAGPANMPSNAGQ